MNDQLRVWDDAAMRAETQLTIPQCEGALSALSALEGHPGMAWTIYYLERIQRQAGSNCVDGTQPTDLIRYQQGVYEGLRIALNALTASYATVNDGGTDTDVQAFFRGVLEHLVELAADEGGQG